MGSISVGQVKGSRYLKGNNFAQNSGAISKYLKSEGKSAVPSYTLKRGSLNKATSDKFSDELLTQIGSAVDGASKMLGKDLIGKPVSASGSAKAAIRSKFSSEGGVVGDLFEATLNTISNSGGFAPANIQQPFDFPNGLSGPAANNFGGTLPSSFVDARKRQSEKPSEDKNSFRRKIINQLGLEVAGSSFAKSPIKKKLANGGDAGTDTVPALLTPGEFVINKDAARRIGQANLDSMNKKGVARFAKGGSVGGVQRFNVGGYVPEGGGSIDTSMFDDTLNPSVYATAKAMQGLGGIIDSLDLKLGDFAGELAQAQKDMNNGASTAQATADVLANIQAKAEEKQMAGDVQLATGVAPTSQSQQGIIGDQQSFGKRLDNTEAAKADTAAGSAIRQKLIRQQEKEIKIIQRRIKNSGVDEQEAENRARNIVTKNYGELASSIQETIDSDQKLRAAEKAVEDKKAAEQGLADNKSSTDAAMEGLGQISSIAGAAQSFVFMGAAASGLAAEFSGLSESTKTAITQTLGYAAASIGAIGTITDLGISLLQTIIMRQSEARASELVIAAKGEEAAASKAAAGSSSKTSANIQGFGNVLLGVSVAFVAVGSAIKYFTAKAKAEAEEMGKVSDEFIKRLNEGESVGSGLAANERGRIDKEIESRTGEETGFVAKALTVALSALALGVVAVVGTLTLPIAAIIAVVAALAGFGFWMGASAAAAEKAKKAQEALTQKVTDSIMGFSELAASQANFKKTLDEINATEGLTDKQKLDRSSKALDDASVFRKDLGQGGRSDKAQERLAELAMGKNKSVGELTEKDFEGEESNLRIFNFTKDYLSNLNSAVDSQLSQSRENLGLARGVAVEGGATNFDEAMKNADFQKAFNRSEDLIGAKFSQERQGRQTQIFTNQAAINSGKLSPENKKLKQEENESLKKQNLDSVSAERGAKEDLKLGQENIFSEIDRAAKAQEAAALASEKAAERLEAVADFGNSLSNFAKSISSIEKEASNLASLASGGIQDFSIDEVTGLKDLKRTGDRGQFSKDLQRARDFLPTQELKTEADGIIKSVEFGADLLQKGLPAVTKMSGFDDLSENQADEQFEKVLRSAGISIDQAEADGFLKQMRQDFDKSFKGGFTEKEFRKMFAPYIDEANAGAKQIQEINGLMNKSINAQGKMVDALMAVNDKEIEVREKAIATNQKADEFRRKARGLEQTGTSKRAGNLALSSNRLSGIGGQFAGQAQAGNLASIAGVRSRAQQELKS